MSTDFSQFKSMLLTGLATVTLAFVAFVYNAQAAALQKATLDIVDIKLAVVELKTIVIELKKTNDHLTEVWYARLATDASVAPVLPRR